MPRLFVCGDIHGDITTMYKLVERYENDNGRKVDGVVQVGDFGIFNNGTEWEYYRDGIREATKPTLIIMGNHEEPGEIRKWVVNPVPDMKLLLDGEITNFLGVNIAGIWGNYSPVSYTDPDRVVNNRYGGGNSPRIGMHINRYAVEYLLKQDANIDMLITHDSARCTFPDYFKTRPMEDWVRVELGLGKQEVSNAAGCPGFDELLRKFKPAKYFFGHLHVYDKTHVGRTEATCLQAIQYDQTKCFEIVEF
jgi:hypothetical protein